MWACGINIGSCSGGSWTVIWRDCACWKGKDTGPLNSGIVYDGDDDDIPPLVLGIDGWSVAYFRSEKEPLPGDYEVRHFRSFQVWRTVLTKQRPPRRLYLRTRIEGPSRDGSRMRFRSAPE